MSTIKQLLTITGTVLIIASCQDANNESDVAATEPAVDTIPKGNRSDTIPTAKYIDLRTGQPVDLYYDAKAKRTYSAITNEPVDWYVNTATGDTVYGRGRYVVNNYIVRTSDSTYKLDDGKIKIDKDEIKIKDGNKKFKMEKGEMKMKEGDLKMKGDTSGVKIKTDDMKKKMDEGETKTKND